MSTVAPSETPKKTPLLSANRVVLIVHGIFIVATVVSLFVAAVSNSLPHAWQPDVAIAIGILGGIISGTVAVNKFLDGSQKWEAIQAGVVPTSVTQQFSGQIASAQAIPSTPDDQMDTQDT